MMKKSISYVICAVLLGVALMLTPRLFSSTPESYDFSNTRSAQTPETMDKLAYGVAPQHPLNEISLGLMSAFSLVLAFVVFKQYKKRTV